jgi:hypothetical protein
MNDQFQRRAWALLIVIGSFVAAAAVWTLPDDSDSARSGAAHHDSRRQSKS